MPTRCYIGQALEVRGDSLLVHLHHHGDLIKVHASQPAGGRATDYAEYPAERTPYVLRAPDRCIDQAQRLGLAVGQFITVLLRARSRGRVCGKRRNSCGSPSATAPTGSMRPAPGRSPSS